jgi:hypothetical protein
MGSKKYPPGTNHWQPSSPLFTKAHRKSLFQLYSCYTRAHSRAYFRSLVDLKQFCYILYGRRPRLLGTILSSKILYRSVYRMSFPLLVHLLSHFNLYCVAHESLVTAFVS